MKKQLLITALAVACLSVSGFAQTKGTSALSFGVGTNTQTYNYPNSENKVRNSNFSLGYGYFFKDNAKLGLDLVYAKGKQENSGNGSIDTKSYGGSISYQKYFPLLKTLYAYAGGRAGYIYGKQEQSSYNYISGIPYYSVTENKSNQYNLGAYGGITWFLSKRFAFETTLLSADITYAKSKQLNPTANNYSNYKSTSFNLSTQGLINDLGFKIYILF